MGHLAHAPVVYDSDSDDDEGYSFGVVDPTSASSSSAAYVATALMATKPKSNQSDKSLRLISRGMVCPNTVAALSDHKAA